MKVLGSIYWQRIQWRGHACAAGFNLEGNLDDFYPLLVEKIGHYLSGIKL